MFNFKLAGEAAIASNPFHGLAYARDVLEGPGLRGPLHRPVKDDWIPAFVELNRELAKYPKNPESFRIEQAEVATRETYNSRTPFRLF